MIIIMIVVSLLLIKRQLLLYIYIKQIVYLFQVTRCKNNRKKVLTSYYLRERTDINFRNFENKLIMWTVLQIIIYRLIWYFQDFHLSFNILKHMKIACLFYVTQCVEFTWIICPWMESWIPKYFLLRILPDEIIRSRNP